MDKLGEPIGREVFTIGRCLYGEMEGLGAFWDCDLDWGALVLCFFFGLIPLHLLQIMAIEGQAYTATS